MATNKRTKLPRKKGVEKTQTYNPVTRQYVQRDAATGRFLNATSGGGAPFADTKLEQQPVVIRLNPNIPPETLERARRAVEQVLQRRRAA